MKNANKLTILFMAILVVGAGAAYLWQMNLGPFGGGRVAGVRSGHLRVDHHHEPMNHLDLLLSYRGGISYNFYGRQAHVFIARYERDELVFHELVSGISTVEAHQISGSMIWGVTAEDGMPRELRVRVGIAGGMSFGHIDFSQIGFSEPAFHTGAQNTTQDTRIEPGERYVLHFWQTGTQWWADADVFSPERLRESEQTLILYIVFE